MNTFRRPWLVLFLVFCLPAQALATVLIACEQHVQAAETSVTPDCHGSDAEHTTETTTANVDSTHPAAHSPANAADANTCFHCSGACQNLKPLSLIAKAHQAFSLDNKALAGLTPATHAGIRNNPARPPCQSVLS